MKKVSFINQGCRLNQSETSALEQLFENEGFDITKNQVPDITVVNTCTVTENGDADTRKIINQLVKQNDQIKIALIGCQSQIQKEALLKFKNVQWVIGNAEKMNTHKIISETYNSNEQLCRTEKIKREPFTINTTSLDSTHTRANIKIQDGCDFYCSFCVIPFARGPARSRVFEDIIREAIELSEAGFQELVLTGVNIGTYEHDGKVILDIVKALSRIEGIKRIRISSIEPTTIPKKLIVEMRDNPKLCRHLHIPLQAGSDDILKAMSRKYSMKEYRDFINFAYETVPDICIGTDVIVGFPGEEKSHFDETVANLLTMPMHYLHVFSYSEREFARSKKLDSPVSSQLIAERSKILRDISNRLKKKYYESQIGKEISCLIEYEKSGSWYGLSDNYIRIKCNSDMKLKNKFVTVKLDNIEKSLILATIKS